MRQRLVPRSSRTFWGLHPAVMLALCSACVASLRAQVLLSSVVDPALPTPRIHIIGAGQFGSSLWLFGAREAYFSPLETGAAFTPFALYPPTFYPLVGLSPRSAGPVAADPSDDGHFYLTGGPVLFPTVQQLYRFESTPPTSFSAVVLSGITSPPKGLAADPASSALFYSHPTAGSGIVKIASSRDGTAVLAFGSSGPGALNTPGALAFGPNGRLYVLDTGDNRVVSFDTAGNYQSAFALTGPAESTALAIDSRGFLYTADGNGGGAIYNTANGQHVGSLEATSRTPDTGGNTFVVADNQNRLYLYDPPTGLHVFDVSAVPEPAATGVAAAGILLAGCLHRRRRK